MAISAAARKGGGAGERGDGGGVSSRSNCLRERGNTLYREAMAATSIPSVRRSRLQDAIQLYCQALSLSGSSSERAMCCKNLGQAFWSRAKLTLVVLEDSRQKNQQLHPQKQRESLSKSWDSLCFDLLSSVGFFLDALEASRPPSQPREWVQGIHWTLVDIAWTVDDLRDSKQQGCNKGKFLDELCSLLQRKLPSNVRLQASAVLHKACAKHRLHTARDNTIGMMAEKEAALEGCFDHLAAAEFHADPTAAAEFLSEIHSLRAAATKELTDFRRRKEEQERLEDHRRRALLGRSSSHRYPDQNTPSHALNRRSGSFRLSSAEAGNRFCDAVRLGVSETSRELEQMFNKMSPGEFLEMVYKRFPPRGAAAALESMHSMDSSELRSAYKRAISHYHPDHNARLSEGRLSDEITKYLIMNFNRLRLVDAA